MPTPTNAQILKEIRELKDITERKFHHHNERLLSIEQWKIATQAVDQYRASRNPNPQKRIEERLLQLLGWALLIIAGAMGVKLL